jgi:hypothetical protein
MVFAWLRGGEFNTIIADIDDYNIFTYVDTDIDVARVFAGKAMLYDIIQCFCQNNLYIRNFPAGYVFLRQPFAGFIQDARYGSLAIHYTTMEFLAIWHLVVMNTRIHLS